MVKDSNEAWHKFRRKDLNFSIGFQYYFPLFIYAEGDMPVSARKLRQK